MNYPYVHRNIFSEPETYEFSECRDLDFFRSWQASRKSKLSALGELSSIRNGVAEAAEGTWNSSENSVSLTLIITAFRDSKMPDGLDTTDSKAIIDSLAQKFEIFRRLFKAYRPNFRRQADVPEASLGEYIAFGHALADAMERYGSPKYLSTLLKLLDALCYLPTSAFTGRDSELLADLIARELQLVTKLEASIEHDTKT